MNAKDLPPTDLLYNDDPYAAECEASVIAASGDDLVLDRTVFYPEGGGQAVPDHGLVAGDRAHLVLDWERSRSPAAGLTCGA